MRLHRFGTAALLLTSLTAGCSGGDDDGEGASATAPATAPVTTAPATTAPATTAPATTTPPTTAPATTAPATTAPATTIPATTAPPMSEAAMIAAGALITIDDLATGWVEGVSAAADEEEDMRIDMLTAECAGVDVALIGNDVLGDSLARSPEFETPDGSFTIQHTVGFAPDEATAALAIEQIGDPDLPGCYAQAVTTMFAEAQASSDPADTLPEGVDLGEITVEVGDLTGLISGEGNWYHFVVPLIAEGQTFEQHVDVIYLRNGAAMSQLSLGGFGAAFPEEDLREIVPLVDQRLAAIA